MSLPVHAADPTWTTWPSSGNQWGYFALKELATLSKLGWPGAESTADKTCDPMELEVRTFLDLPVSFWQVKNLLDACKEVRRASSFWHACTWGTCESKTKFQTFLGLVWFSHRRIVWCELSCHSRAHRDCTWLENPPCITAWWCYFTILKNMSLTMRRMTSHMCDGK
jgi:hypothetical protein